MNCYLFQTTREIDDMHDFIGWKALMGCFTSHGAAKKYADELVNGSKWIDGFQLVDVPRGNRFLGLVPEIIEIGNTDYDPDLKRQYIIWEKVQDYSTIVYVADGAIIKA